MKKNKMIKILKAICLVFIATLVIFIAIGTITFLINLALRNSVAPFQVVSFVLCFASVVALIVYLRND